jgi:hypothetical protein
MPQVALFEASVRELLAQALPTDGPGCHNPDSARYLSRQARAEWTCFHREVESELGARGSFRDVRDVAAKAAENAAGRAALSHVLEHDATGTVASKDTCTASMTAGATLGKRSTASRKRLFNTTTSRSSIKTWPIAIVEHDHAQRVAGVGQNSVMTPSSIDHPGAQHGSGQQTAPLVTQNPALLLRDTQQPRAPRRQRPGVSSYRIFMTVVLVCVVLIDEWSDQSLTPILSPAIVGPASVIIWALTLLGSFDIGPVARIWDAIRPGQEACPKTR